MNPGASRTPEPSLQLLGMKVNLLDPEQAVAAILSSAAEGRAGYVCVTNVHQCMMTFDDPGFRAVVNDSELVLPDSTILRWAFGLRHRIRTPASEKGADLMLSLCAAAEQGGMPIALIGGKDEAVLNTLSVKLLDRFPGLQIGFRHSPPFHPASPAEVRQLAADLNASGVKLIFVGLGCPKQERWMAQYKPLLHAIMIGVGAAFDFNAGAVRPSPAWVHKAGLEWLYRLLSEPHRLWRRYLTTSPRFLFHLALDMAGFPQRGRQ